MNVLSTMITPYTSDGHVDYDTACKYVDWYYESGLDGIFAVCQSSEIFYLSLEERVELNRRVYQRAKTLNENFLIVSSGHVSDTLAGQVKELNAVYESGTDALILITNRLDIHNEGDDVFIANGEKLLAALPADVPLGLYECPHPYKRLVTPKILDWCRSTGRFAYMKDTCCDAAEIARRTAQLENSGFRLLNANAQTLLETMQSGAQGYCGIMCNFHPKLYAWLKNNWQVQPEKAALVQAALGSLAFTECLAYPLTAKYHMNLCGIPTETIGRSRKEEELTDYARSCMQQMKLLTDRLEKELGL
jgi:4-hydroxy-tetrahydrodipicolinate synthase